LKYIELKLIKKRQNIRRKEMIDDAFHLYFHEDDLQNQDPVELVNYASELKRLSSQSEHILTQTVRFAKAMEDSTAVV
jgi:hypothetical protein